VVITVAAIRVGGARNCCQTGAAASGAAAELETLPLLLMDSQAGHCMAGLKLFDSARACSPQSQALNLGHAWPGILTTEGKGGVNTRSDGIGIF
jgi:hypothetical protein